MANGNSVVSDQDFFDDETHDPLTFGNAQRIGGTAQTGEEGCQGLGKAKECSPVRGLIGDGLKLRADRTFALAEHGHALAQLLNR